MLGGGSWYGVEWLKLMKTFIGCETLTCKRVFREIKVQIGLLNQVSTHCLMEIEKRKEGNLFAQGEAPCIGGATFKAS